MYVLAAVAFSREDEEEVKTNLDVIRQLAQTIAAQVMQRADLQGGSPVHLNVLPRESAWYVESSIMDELRQKNHGISPLDSSLYAIEVGLSDVKVGYANIRKDGFFGGKTIDRTIRLRLTAKVVERQTGVLLFSSDVEESKMDTIALSAVSEVENPALTITRGRVPAEGFLSGIAEPVIIVGAIAVAVVLLFTVRS